MCEAAWKTPAGRGPACSPATRVRELRANQCWAAEARRQPRLAWPPPWRPRPPGALHVSGSHSRPAGRSRPRPARTPRAARAGRPRAAGTDPACSAAASRAARAARPHLTRGCPASGGRLSRRGRQPRDPCSGNTYACRVRVCACALTRVSPSSALLLSWRLSRAAKHGPNTRAHTTGSSSGLCSGSWHPGTPFPPGPNEARHRYGPFSGASRQPVGKPRARRAVRRRKGLRAGIDVEKLRPCARLVGL